MTDRAVMERDAVDVKWINSIHADLGPAIVDGRAGIMNWDGAICGAFRRIYFMRLLLFSNFNI